MPTEVGSSLIYFTMLMSHLSKEAHSPLQIYELHINYKVNQNIKGGPRGPRQNERMQYILAKTSL